MKRWLCVLAMACLCLPAVAEGEKGSSTDSRALEILKKTDAAAKAVSGASYEATATPSGVATNFVQPASGRIAIFGWNGGMPARFVGQVKTKRPGSDEKINVTFGGDGDSYFLVDHVSKKAYEDMDPGVLGSSANVMFALGMMEFVHDTPFDDEINADTQELLDDEAVGGEDCYQIRVVYSGGRGESIWFISKKDFLPRKRVRVFNTPDGEGAIEIAMNNLIIEPEMDPSLFKLDLPAGYEQIDDFAP